MPFAAALSCHPQPAAAIGECIGELLDAHGPHPDLVVLFVTNAHAPALDELCRTTRTLLQPGCLVALPAGSIIGGNREVEDQPALSLWAAWGLGEVVAGHLDPALAGSGAGTLDWTALDELIARSPGAGGADGASTLLLLVDPLSFPIDEALTHLATAHPGLAVIGGLLPGGGRPGDALVCLDDARHRRGAVAVLVPAEVTTVVSQGCRPIGEPFTVTRAEGNVLAELGSRPALARLQELAAGLSPDDRELLARGVHLGRVIDEHLLDHRRGDFLIRAVLGAQTETGALIVGDRVQVGDTVQFQVRDADSAHEDLVELLAGRQADAALVFTCNGRGRHLFGVDDHDAAAISELTGAGAVAGLFCAGEVGPVGSRSFLHGFTASVALFRERSDAT